MVKGPIKSTTTEVSKAMIKAALFAMFNIDSNNCREKKTFYSDLNGGQLSIGCFEEELKEDFYFFVPYHRKYFKLEKRADITFYAKDDKYGKYIIPLSDCEELEMLREEVEISKNDVQRKDDWSTVEFFSESEDKPFKEMTLRQYACIHLKVPNSGVDWLDKIIKQAK